MTDMEDVEQAVRRSHCDRKGEEHACVGQCTITRDGVSLSCVLCGKGDIPVGAIFWNLNRHRISKEARAAAARVVGAAGLDWDKLSTEAQVRCCVALIEAAKEVAA